MYKAVIFDLDGTLLDTSVGVMDSLIYTIEKMGYASLAEEVMRTFIGPPIKKSLIKAYKLEEAEADQATAVFRDRYKNVDLLKAEVYDGLFELLERIKESGCKIGVATLKREDYAIDILKHFGIDKYCNSICGSDFASKMNKADVLQKCMEQLNVESAKETVLIGDTYSDAEGAQALGVDFLAVTFGFGFTSEDDIKSHPYVFVAESMKQIETYLRDRI